MKQVHSAGIITYIKDTTRYPSTRRRQGFGGQAAFTTEPDEVSGRAGGNEILYLILQYGAGHWDFPKGKIENGETKQEAALRELMEETGLTAEIDDAFEETFNYIFTDQNKELAQKTVYFFVGTANSKDVKLSDEHTDYKWLPFNDAFEQLTYDNAKELLKKAHEHIQKQISPV